MAYLPNFASVASHGVPTWYDDAKLGIFVHWGLYSVPAWAPNGADIDDQVAHAGWEAMFANNPYAEWYLNTLRIGDTATRRHHLGTYGPTMSYDDFAVAFERGADSFEPDSWAALFGDVGARYVVLTTKHHDGYLLWPGASSPRKGVRYASNRDVVGDLTHAVRARGMRMGLYYSGGLDWTFDQRPVRGYMDVYSTIVQDPEFVAYATGHWHDLIDRYAPSILWNDIGAPRAFDLAALYARYYNAVPDGLVNDRWGQVLPRRIPGAGEQINPPPARHYDYTTPEYAKHYVLTSHRWEATRGIGHSFGFNQNEGPEDYVSVDDLVRSLVDIVSKNGNLLLNVGPAADGTIPPLQRERLLGLGEWLRVNGEAIFGTRPWVTAEGRTAEGVDLRYTVSGDTLNVILLDTPAGGQVCLPDLVARADTHASLLGRDQPVSATQTPAGLLLTMPGQPVAGPAHAFRLAPIPATASARST